MASVRLSSSCILHVPPFALPLQFNEMLLAVSCACRCVQVTHPSFSSTCRLPAHPQLRARSRCGINSIMILFLLFFLYERKKKLKYINYRSIFFQVIICLVLFRGNRLNDKEKQTCRTGSVVMAVPTNVSRENI